MTNCQQELSATAEPSESDDGYCGGIVWSRIAGGGYNGVDGECSLPAGHEGDCQC